MSWLHVAKIIGLDGQGAWLVVPGAEDRILRAAMMSTGEPIRYLPTFRGWLVPSSSEWVLWSAVKHTCGEGAVCRTCIASDVPCDAWVALVERRFADAIEEQQGRGLVYLPQTQRHQQAYTPVWPEQDWDQGPTAGRRSRRQQRPQPQWPWDEAPPRQQRGGSTYRAPPPPPAPPPAPTREERLAAAAKVLGVAWPAGKADVARAFRAAALRVHPDLGGTNEKMREVIEARDVLLRAA